MGAKIVKTPERIVSRLPHWPDDDCDPQRPTVTITTERMPSTRAEYIVDMRLSDELTAEWLASYVASRAFWRDFGDWVDARR